MEILALLLLVPVAAPFVAKAIWKHEIVGWEIAANVLLISLLTVLGWYLGRSIHLADIEIWNGQVVSKNSERVSCTHSYECNCRWRCSGSGSERSCYEVCSTCYEHPWDLDWILKTSIGRITIDRIDPRGLLEPPRFTRAYAGEPVSLDRGFQNYVKAAASSLFNAGVEETLLARFDAELPRYPADIYDYHRLDRVLAQGVNLPDLAEWNRDASMRLRDIGPTKQSNWVVVITRNMDPDYAEGLRVKWRGGKFNDTVLVIGAPDFPRIGWVRVLSWSDRELFKVRIRDEVLALGEVDRVRVLDVLERHVVDGFHRKRIDDFEYLLAEVLPPTWALWLIVLLSLGGSCALSRHFARNEHRVLPASAGGR